MSKNIKTLANDFKNTGLLEIEIKDLRKRCDQLEAYNNQLLEELDRARNIDRNNIIKLHLTPEQEILEQQIHRIQAVSRERTLTLEETKMLDLHIKNKRLLDDKSTVNAEYKDLNASVNDLLRLAEGEPSDVTKNAQSKTGTKVTLG